MYTWDKGSVPYIFIILWVQTCRYCLDQGPEIGDHQENPVEALSYIKLDAQKRLHGLPVAMTTGRQSSSFKNSSFINVYITDINSWQLARLYEKFQQCLH